MSPRRPIAAVALVVLAALAGCASPFAAPGTGSDPGAAGADGVASGRPADPPTDRLGWEAGVWYDESIAANQSDGLNESERAALVARAMARVEVLRGLEFRETVPVEVISRAAFRRESVAADLDSDRAAWNDRVWEALLLVGEDRRASDAIAGVYGASVLGYYSPSEERIVIVSDADAPSIPYATLAHELVHALQDQRFGLDGAVPPTLDARLARASLVEGDARYVETLYRERCGRAWSCAAAPGGSGDRGGGALDFDFDVFALLYAPYSEGPTFVSALRARGGWAAVNEAHRNPPASTEQALHPEAYPDERPANVTVPDRSAAAWSRFDGDPATDTVGEASLYVAMWANGGIARESLYRDADPYSAYDYESPVTAGWAGDAVVPYRRGSGEGAAHGYVFRTVWDTEADAREFERAYERVLTDSLPSTRTAPDTRVVESGPFADAFRVTRTGRTVTVVNAPTAGQLDAVHRRRTP